MKTITKIATAAILSLSLAPLALAEKNKSDSPAKSSLPFTAPEMASLPAASSTITKIAFGSCINEERAMPIWNSILKKNPDLFLFTGDNVYADNNRGQWVNKPDPAEFDFAYNTLAKNADFSNFAKKVPMMAIFDDHDYGKNDAGKEYPLKDVAKQKMLDFFRVPASAPVRKHEGAYDSKIFGPEGKKVQIIMLDTRTFRSALTKTDDRGKPGKERYLPSQDPKQDMLGAKQWKWLQAELTKPADIRLVVTGIQLIADTHGWEAWSTMPKQRQKLYDMINTVETGSVFVISGDRHVGGLYRKNDGMKKPLYEITSSSMNFSFNPSKDITSEWDKKHQIGTLYGPENYGLIEINWDEKLIALKVNNKQNTTVRQLNLPSN